MQDNLPNKNTLNPWSVMIVIGLLLGTIGFLFMVAQVVRVGDAVDLSPSTELLDSDYVRGNPDAPITLIEYSDYECPYCQRFHPTVSTLVSQRTDVKWIYRQFPLPIHSLAREKSLAALCVGSLAGDDAFWNFTDTLFSLSTSATMTEVVQVADKIGVSKDELRACMADERIVATLEQSLIDGQNAGITGTPGMLILGPNGQSRLVSGAIPLSKLEQLINELK